MGSARPSEPQPLGTPGSELRKLQYIVFRKTRRCQARLPETLAARHAACRKHSLPGHEQKTHCKTLYYVRSTDFLLETVTLGLTDRQLNSFFLFIHRQAFDRDLT